MAVGLGPAKDMDNRTGQWDKCLTKLRNHARIVQLRALVVV